MQRAERWALLVARPLDLLSSFTRPAVWLLGATSDLVVRLAGVDPQAQPRRDRPGRAARHRRRQPRLHQGAARPSSPARSRSPTGSCARCSYPGCRSSRSTAGPPRRPPGWCWPPPATPGPRWSRHGGLDDAVGRDPPARPGRRAGRPAGRRVRPPADAAARLAAGGRRAAPVQGRAAAHRPGGRRARRGRRDRHPGGPPGGDRRGDLRRDRPGRARGAHRGRTASLLLPGTFPVHDLPDIGVELPDRPAGDYTTVAGLVLACLGHIPTVAGESVTIDGWEMAVTGVDRRAISQIRLHQAPTTSRHRRAGTRPRRSPRLTCRPAEGSASGPRPRGPGLASGALSPAGTDPRTGSPAPGGAAGSGRRGTGGCPGSTPARSPGSARARTGAAAPDQPAPHPAPPVAGHQHVGEPEPAVRETAPHHHVHHPPQPPPVQVVRGTAEQFTRSHGRRPVSGRSGAGAARSPPAGGAVRRRGPAAGPRCRSGRPGRTGCAAASTPPR